MRAFMSDRSARPTATKEGMMRGYWRVVAGGQTVKSGLRTRAGAESEAFASRPVLALAEARAILGETEPERVAEGYENYRGASDMRVTVLTRDHDAYRVASDCLADALRAFVADGGIE